MDLELTRNNYFAEHAVKNIVQLVVSLNDITFTKRLSSLIGRRFELPCDFLLTPLPASEKNRKDTLMRYKKIEVITKNGLTGLEIP